MYGMNLFGITKVSTFLTQYLILCGYWTVQKHLIIFKSIKIVKK